MKPRQYITDNKQPMHKSRGRRCGERGETATWLCGVAAILSSMLLRRDAAFPQSHRRCGRRVADRRPPSGDNGERRVATTTLYTLAVGRQADGQSPGGTPRSQGGMIVREVTRVIVINHRVTRDSRASISHRAAYRGRRARARSGDVGIYDRPRMELE